MSGVSGREMRDAQRDPDRDSVIVGAMIVAVLLVAAGAGLLALALAGPLVAVAIALLVPGMLIFAAAALARRRAAR